MFTARSDYSIEEQSFTGSSREERQLSAIGISSDRNPPAIRTFSDQNFLTSWLKQRPASLIREAGYKFSIYKLKPRAFEMCVVGTCSSPGCKCRDWRHTIIEPDPLLIVCSLRVSNRASLIERLYFNGSPTIFNSLAIIRSPARLYAE